MKKITQRIRTLNRIKCPEISNAAEDRSNIVLLLKYLIFGANYKSKPLPPGLVLYGDKDFTSNPASYKNVKKVPNLVSREIKGGSHFLHQQSAIEVNQYIDEFLYGSADKPATPTTVT